MKESRKNLAIWTHGGVGGGLFGQGFPLIVQIVERLAIHFDVTVYSAASIPKEFNTKGYKAVSPSVKLKWLWIRWIYLIICFLKHHSKVRYTVLYSFWGYPAGTVIVALGKICEIPSVVNLLGSETADVPQINYGHLRGKTKGILQWTFRHATNLVAVSQSQVDSLEQMGFLRKIHIIPWGVNTDIFYATPRKIKLPIKIIHIANLTEVKDQETLIRTFQIIKNFMPAKLKIVGPDFLNGKLQNMVVSNGLENDIEFVGPVPHSKIIEYYRWADLFMLTSLSEGQNNSITEAMACGILPVSTAVGIMDKSFGNKVGIVTACADYESLGNKVIELYTNQEEWEKKRNAALKWATYYNLDWTIEQLRKVLNYAK